MKISGVKADVSKEFCFFLELLLIGPLKLNGFPPFLRGVHCPKRFFEYPEIQFPGSKTSSFNNKLLWER